MQDAALAATVAPQPRAPLLEVHPGVVPQHPEVRHPYVPRFPAYLVDGRRGFLPVDVGVGKRVTESSAAPPGPGLRRLPHCLPRPWIPQPHVARVPEGPPTDSGRKEQSSAPNRHQLRRHGRFDGAPTESPDLTGGPQRNAVHGKDAVLTVRALEGGVDGVAGGPGVCGYCVNRGLVDSGVGRVGPVDGTNVAAAGGVVEVEPGGLYRPDNRDVRPSAAEGCDLIDVRPHGAGVGEGPVVGGDLPPVGDPEGAVLGSSRKRGCDPVGGRADVGDGSSVEADKRARRRSSSEEGLNPIVDGLLSQLPHREAVGSGGEGAGAKDGEQDGEYIRIAVDEDGPAAGTGEDGKEGIGAAGAEGGGGSLEDYAADVKLDAVGGLHVAAAGEAAGEGRGEGVEDNSTASRGKGGIGMRAALGGEGHRHLDPSRSPHVPIEPNPARFDCRWGSKCSATPGGGLCRIAHGPRRREARPATELERCLIVGFPHRASAGRVCLPPARERSPKLRYDSTQRLTIASVD